MSQLEQSGTAIGFVVLIACIAMAVFIFPGLVDTDTQSVKTESQIIELEKGESADLVNSNYSVTLLSVNTSTSEATYNITNGNSTTFTSTIDMNRTLEFTNQTITVNLTSLEQSVGRGNMTSFNLIDTYGDGSEDGSKRIFGDTRDNEPIKNSIRFKSKNSGYLQNITVNLANQVSGDDYGFTVNVYLKEGKPNGDFTSGQLVRENYDPAYALPLSKTIEIDETFIEADTNYTITFVTSGSDNDGSFDSLLLEVDTSPTNVWYYDNIAQEHTMYANVDFTIQEATKGETKATSTFYVQNFSDNEKANSLWQIVTVLFVVSVIYVVITTSIGKDDTL